MKFQWIFFLLFFLLGCKSQDDSETQYQMLADWIYAREIDILGNVNIIIDRPPGTEILIIKLGFNHHSHCVYYQVPYKNKQGKISVVETKGDLSCPETRVDNNKYELEKIKNVIINYDNFILKLSYLKNNKGEIIEVPLYNISKSNIHQKFKNKTTISKASGLKLLSDKTKTIGNLSDRFSKQNALRCHQVNSKCETLGEIRCNECRYGWYEVVDYNCPQGGSKFCGQNHCGEKNEPACPRGYKLFENEDTGICQSDLTAVFNADHILICQ